MKMITVMNKQVCVHTLRKSCEHGCLCGAIADILVSAMHTEFAFLVLFAKFGLLLGAVGVYLVHLEEHLHV